VRMTITIGFLFTLLLQSILANTAEFEPHAVSHEDVWLMKRLDKPEPSPDGKWAVISVTEPSYEEDGDVSDLWLIATDGNTEPRRLTASKEAEKSPQWSPDGSRLAFSSSRGEDEEGDKKPSQIYVLDMTGPGEAIQITDLVTGAEAPEWSPDGRKIAFQSRVYPNTASNEENQAEKDRRADLEYEVSAYDIFPIRQWDHWRDDLVTHLFVQDAKAGAEAKDLLVGTDLVKEKGYAGVPTRSSEELQQIWTPDGREIVFAATKNHHEAARAHVLHHLYKISADGGVPTRLTDSENWTCTDPQFAADGSALYCNYEAQNDFVYNLNRVAGFTWPPRGADQKLPEPQIVTASLDRSVIDYTLSSNGRTLYVSANDQGRVRLFAVPARGGKARVLDELSRGVFSGPKATAKALIANWQDSTHPSEVVRIDPGNGTTVPITAFNIERAGTLDRQPFREFWFKSSKGREIHSWLALPPDFDENGKYPLVLAIHGGPFSSSLDADHVRWSPHLLASPGYVVLLTDYTGSVGYGEEFSRNIQNDPLKTPGEELNEAVDEAIKQFAFIDGDRLGATGASYGGHLINWLQATTTRYKTLVGHAGLVSLEGQWSTSDVIYHREIMNGGPPWGDSTIWKEQSPSTYANNFATPVMLTIGEIDYRVPINQTIAAWSYLQRNNIESRLLVFHEHNHWIMKGPSARYFWEEVHAWLEKYLN